MEVISDPILLKIPDAARLLSVSERTIWQLIRDKRLIPARISPKAVRIEKIELERFISEIRDEK